MNKRGIISDAFILFGFTLIIVGCAILSSRTVLIVAGTMLMATGVAIWLIGRRRRL